jgi:phosphatidylglycerophosphatase A
VNRFKLFLVSAGFLGCSPWAPGTVGTLGGVALAWALSGTSRYLLWTVLACAVIYAVGRSLGPWSERHAGGKDPGFFVLDEVLGYLVTVAWTSGPSPLTLVVGFFVFRFFDIFKPGPARRLERVPGGDGILLDDLVAGLYGFVLVLLPARLLLDLPWAAGG